MSLIKRNNLTKYFGFVNVAFVAIFIGGSLLYAFLEKLGRLDLFLPSIQSAPSLITLFFIVVFIFIKLFFVCVFPCFIVYMINLFEKNFDKKIL